LYLIGRDVGAREFTVAQSDSHFGSYSIVLKSYSAALCTHVYQ